jgi:hypothetical protein
MGRAGCWVGAGEDVDGLAVVECVNLDDDLAWT